MSTGGGLGVLMVSSVTSGGVTHSLVVNPSCIAPLCTLARAVKAASISSLDAFELGPVIRYADVVVVVEIVGVFVFEVDVVSV